MRCAQIIVQVCFRELQILAQLGHLLSIFQGDYLFPPSIQGARKSRFLDLKLGDIHLFRSLQVNPYQYNYNGFNKITE